nr:M23 family metallopeptidase [uncultured Sphingomonas sp.]
MIRISLLAWSLAALALGAGAIGYAATGEQESQRSEPGPSLSPRGLAPDSVIDAGLPDLVVPMPQGEELTASLLAAGAGGLDAALADGAAGNSSPVAGRPLRLWFGPALTSGARRLDRVEFRPSLDRTVIIARVGDDFVAREVAEIVDETPVRIRLNGSSDVRAEFAKAKLPQALTNQLTAKIGKQRFSTIDLIVAHEQAGAAGDYGAPLYLGLHLQNGAVQRWLNVNGELRPLGMASPASGLIMPVSGRVTSLPGMRLHPILRYLRWHRGTDLSAPAGTPVRAALGGRVVHAGWRGGYGRAVKLSHPDGSETLYAHLQAIEAQVGARVAQGDIVGTVGASGLATGPHLHFEWSRGGEALRPSFSSGDHPNQEALSRELLADLQSVLTAPFRLPPQRRS